EHMAEGISVVAPKVSDRLEVRLQMSQQPDHLDIAMGLSLQPTARPQPVQIAVNVHGISGASLIRPGIQKLLQDALEGRFGIVITESLDRVSRDQEDIAHNFKRIS